MRRARSRRSTYRRSRQTAGPPVARGSQEFLLSSRCTPTPASGRRVSRAKCRLHPLYRSTPPIGGARGGRLPDRRSQCGTTGRQPDTGYGIGRPGRDLAEHAGRNVARVVSPNTLSARVRPHAASRAVFATASVARAAAKTPVRTAVTSATTPRSGWRHPIGSPPAGDRHWRAWTPSGDVPALLADIAGIGPFFTVATGPAPAGGRLGVPARSRDTVGYRGGRPAARPDRRGPRRAGDRRPGRGVDGVPGSRGPGGRPAVRRGRGARRGTGAGVDAPRRRARPSAALAAGGSGAVAVVGRTGRATSVRAPTWRSSTSSPSCSRRWSRRSARGRRCRRGCCGATRRRRWRGRGGWSPLPGRAPRHPARSLAERLLTTPPLDATAALRAPEPPDAGWTFRRRSCCLYYRVPGGGVCGDCVLRDRAPPLTPARVAHRRAAGRSSGGSLRLAGSVAPPSSAP